MKHQKVIIIPERIAKTVTVAGYFETFREIKNDYKNGENAYVALEEQRQQIGFNPRYSNYSSFKSAKSRHDKTFTGQIKYV